MAVFTVTELDTAPAAPSQWQQYYNPADDNLYIQLLRATEATAKDIIASPAGAVRVNNVVTITTVSAHGLIVGDEVVLENVADSSFNGTVIVLSVPSLVTFTCAQVGADASSGSAGPPVATETPAYPKWQDVSTGREVRDSVRVNDTLVRAKYIGRDYQTFLDEGVSFLREKFGDTFTDFVSTDFGVMFIKYVSAALDTLAWYMDKEVSEWYYPLMRLRSRAELLARMSAYKPRPSTACTVDLTLTLAQEYAFEVMVPQRFQFQGPNSMIFELSQDVRFSPGETVKTSVPAVQGRTITEDFVSNGQPNFTVVFQSLEASEFVASGTVEIYVNGVLWDTYDFLPYERVNAVEIIYGATPPMGLFGDGVVGNIPDRGSSILARYIATKGKLGRAASSDTIKDPISSLVINQQTIAISATNPETASGGDDPESLQEIVATAPAYYKTADRAVTQQDVTTLASNFASGPAGTVAMAKANIVRGIADDLALQAELASLQGLADGLDAYLDEITTQVALISASRELIKVQTAEITTQLSTLDSSLASASAGLETGKVALENMPYQQLYARGNGATGLFSVVLDRYPLFPGSVLLWVDDLVVTSMGWGTDGDCDLVAGRLNSATATFQASWVGRLIKIAGDMRVITRFIDASNIVYSGSRIVGTALAFETYDPAVYAVDDGGGNLTGFGISSGSVGYSSGQVDVQFTQAPGLDKDVFAQYGYADSTISTYMDNAISDIGDGQTASGEIATATAEIDSEAANIAAAETAIGAQITLSLAIPAAMESSIDDLEAYLDEHLSGECKANIVLVQVLVVDQNGFYAAPTQALLTALKAYLDARAVVPTTIATVSGFYNVVAVNMSYALKILDPYKFAEVKARLQLDIDSMFQGRAYGASLFRSTYYNRAVPDKVTGQGGIVGVDYANIVISSTTFPDTANAGTPPSVDSNGNLVISKMMVLTKGTITITQIT